LRFLRVLYAAAAKSTARLYARLREPVGRHNIGSLPT
jgi:hypothetical protein